MIQLETISDGMLDKEISIAGKIVNVFKTGGPLLLTLDDGTATFTIKIFSRNPAFNQTFEQGMYVQASIVVKSFQGQLEGQVSTITFLQGSEKDKVEQKIAQHQKSLFKVADRAFMVESEVLDALKPKIIHVAQCVKEAIGTNRPIIVRHHNDCDGYSAGIALERAIVPLLLQRHGSDRAVWQYFSRSVCLAPFYDIEDSIRDMFKSIDRAVRGDAMPLILIVDNGSTHEDVLAIEHAKLFGSDVIVIDHHYFGQDVVSERVIEHINPFLVGYDSNYAAGILCSEIAKFIYPQAKVEHIPALAGLADRVQLPQLEHYIALAKEYTLEELHELTRVIDYITYMIRTNEAREYMDMVFGQDVAIQKKLVKLFLPHIEQLDQKAIAIGKQQVEQVMCGNVMLQILDIEHTFSRGTYPRPGKTVGMVHDSYQNACVTIGVMSDGITIRAKDNAGFSVHDFLAYVHKVVPQAYADGGGHACAGSLRFVPKYKDAVVDAIKEYIKQIVL
ncbi:MAG: DHH family phosphoesterase [Candidatus Woesearchaeota archaeon]